MSSRKGTGSSNWLLVAAGLLMVPLLLVVTGALDDDADVETGAGDEVSLTTPDVEPSPTQETSADEEMSSTAESPTADAATPTAEPEPTPLPEPTATPTPAPTATPTPVPTPTAEPETGGVVRSNPDAVLPADAPDDIVRSLERSAAGEVPPSQAVISKSRIFLFGAVPTAEAAAEIVELAAQILGPDNVFDFYTIHPDAASASDGDIRVDDTILFETNSAVIAPEFEPLLNQAVALMTIRPAVEMRVVGHTDSVGTAAYNQALSERRALAVVEYLVSRGVDRNRLEAIGRGERDPIASNATEGGKELNRRIQVFLSNVLG